VSRIGRVELIVVGVVIARQRIGGGMLDMARVSLLEECLRSNAPAMVAARLAHIVTLDLMLNTAMEKQRINVMVVVMVVMLRLCLGRWVSEDCAGNSWRIKGRRDRRKGRDGT
jgi:hypothetical protein